jgi:hypothetical protein
VQREKVIAMSDTDTLTLAPTQHDKLGIIHCGVSYASSALMLLNQSWSGLHHHYERLAA